MKVLEEGFGEPHVIKKEEGKEVIESEEFMRSPMLIPWRIGTNFMLTGVEERDGHFDSLNYFNIDSSENYL